MGLEEFPHAVANVIHEERGWKVHAALVLGTFRFFDPI